MSQEDELPPLDDFEEELKSIKQQNKAGGGDYTQVNTRHIENEEEQSKAIKSKLQKQIQSKTHNEEVAPNSSVPQKQFGGMKKGFFGNSKNEQASSAKASQQKIPEIKGKKGHNPLQIKEVQEAMKVNNYLESTRKEWMSEKFLEDVSTNSKVSKLFSNPEYAAAIELFKTNPREALARYGHDRQFMEGFQEFCRLMGTQFQNIAK